MENEYIILIADRNPRIRDFMQRELRSEGHRVYTAENADQLKNWIHRPGRLDALVIDPDMPGMESQTHLVDMLAVRPELAVIFHCLASDCASLKTPCRVLAFVEKSGQSVDLLKQQIRSILSGQHQGEGAISSPVK